MSVLWWADEMVKLAGMADHSAAELAGPSGIVALQWLTRE
jgi:hypothetical protein